MRPARARAGRGRRSSSSCGPPGGLLIGAGIIAAACSQPAAVAATMCRTSQARISLSRRSIMASNRLSIMGTKHVISAGHYLAAHAGFEVLEAGGNAIDAGVAAGIAIGVLQTDKVNFAGVAPQIIYTAKNRKVSCIDGLGVWPKAITPDYFQKKHGGKIPKGVERCVVPAA